MNDKHSLQANLTNTSDGGAFVRTPFNVQQLFGKKWVKIKTWIDGEPYRGTLVRVSEPFHILIVLREIRAKIEKSFSDKVEVTIQEDDEPCLVNVPPDMSQAVNQHPHANKIFRQLSYTHQKEYVCWDEVSRRETTRQSRINKTIELLELGKKTHKSGWSAFKSLH